MTDFYHPRSENELAEIYQDARAKPDPWEQTPFGFFLQLRLLVSLRAVEAMSLEGRLRRGLGKPCLPMPEQPAFCEASASKGSESTEAKAACGAFGQGSSEDRCQSEIETMSE